MKRTLVITLFLLLINCLYAQKTTLKAGPLLGYVDFREACVWVQTSGPATVKLQYYSHKDTLYETAAVATAAPNHFTAKLILNRIEPGHTYTYKVVVNNKPATPQKSYLVTVPPLWRWRTDPPAFKFAAGSCHYSNQTVYDRPGTPYGDTLPGIFNSIVSKQPGFMVWLGDNIYLREPDWNTKTGIYSRYDHTRSNHELNNLFSYCPNYAIWDDHDFGPNNSDRSFWNKETALEAFKDYWPNPGFGVQGEKGIATFFNHADADFFLLDDRYYRTPEDAAPHEAEILGKTQLEWLKDNLVASPAKFKFVAVGSQFLNTAPVGENFINSPRERQELISHIYKHKIKNVIFLTGDRHHSEVSILKADSMPAIYDFTVSPLTSGTGNRAGQEANTLRADGTLIAGKRNFATFEITGTRNARKLTVIYYGREGEELLKYEIEAEN